VAATKGAPSTTRPINAALFKHENGKYHFALYHTEGGVFQRGEGFTKVKDRDAGLQHVPRLRQDSIFFDRIERGGCFMDILNNEDDREIARNCLKTAEAKAKPAPDSKAVPKSESKARKTDEVYKDELYGFKSDHLQLVEGIGPKIQPAPERRRHRYLAPALQGQAGTAQGDPDRRRSPLPDAQLNMLAPPGQFRCRWPPEENDRVAEIPRHG